MEWLSNARNHSSIINDLLYPKLDKNKLGSLKERMHAVSDHPVYNFLHTYYRYSKIDLILFSPGINCVRSEFNIGNFTVYQRMLQKKISINISAADFSSRMRMVIFINILRKMLITQRKFQLDISELLWIAIEIFSPQPILVNHTSGASGCMNGRWSIAQKPATRRKTIKISHSE